MRPYAELLEFNQPNQVRKEGFTRIRDAFPGLEEYSPDYEYGGKELGGYVANPERIVEFAGRWDYGEKNARKLGEYSRKPDPESGPEAYKDVPIIQKYIDMGHESMLEMADATFFIECSRVVSHELVRHRLVSYQQESQRFVKYDGEESDELFYFPPEAASFDGIYSYPDTYDEEGHVLQEEGSSGMPAEDAMTGLYDAALDTYRELRKAGVPPQIARYVFPNAMRTRMVMKTNLREWRHICKLRLDKSAQPEMQELMIQIYDQLVDIFPNVMYDALDGERGVR